MLWKEDDLLLRVDTAVIRLESRVWMVIDYSDIPAGGFNSAGGTASVINLQGNKQFVESTAPGQFLVPSQGIQVTSDPGPDNETSSSLLIPIISNSYRLRLILHRNVNVVGCYVPSRTSVRREEDERDRARRNRKVQAIREQHGLNWNARILDDRKGIHHGGTKTRRQWPFERYHYNWLITI